MDLKLLATVFITVFLAEMADKTQVATLFYASNADHSKLTVLIGSALALISASAVAVLVGGFISRWFQTRHISWVAGAGFILIGIWMISKGR